MKSEQHKTIPAVELSNITLAYQDKPIVKHLTGRIEAGSLTAIMGANGCGKSTLVKAIVGIIEPVQGEIKRLFPQGQTAYLAQLNEIDRLFPITVFDFVACGLWAQVGTFKALSETHIETIHQALQAVGMGAYQQQLIGELSGGQFQRIRFAQLALQEAQIYILDEPFAAVDEHTITDLMCLLHYWHEQGKTIIAVLHDIELVQRQFPQVIVLGEQELIGWGDTPLHLERYRHVNTPLNAEHNAPSSVAKASAKAKSKNRAKPSQKASA